MLFKNIIGWFWLNINNWWDKKKINKFLKSELKYFYVYVIRYWM